MTCAGCQKRREAIARMATKLGGTIVFGGRRRALVPENDSTKSHPAGMDQSAAFAGAGTDGGAGIGDKAGTAGDPGAARGSIEGRAG
jgi:hypothetical protein